MEGIQNQSYSSKELLDVQSFLLEAKKEIFELKSENERLKVKVWDPVFIHPFFLKYMH